MLWCAIQRQKTELKNLLLRRCCRRCSLRRTQSRCLNVNPSLFFSTQPRPNNKNHHNPTTTTFRHNGDRRNNRIRGFSDLSSSSSGGGGAETTPQQETLLAPPNNNPDLLGTFTWEDWQTRLQELVHRLEELPPHNTDLMNTETEHGSVDVGEHWIGMGARVLAVDQLLQRLIEEAATGSIVSQRVLLSHGDDDHLSQLSMAVLQSWLDVSRVFPLSPIPLEYAQLRLNWNIINNRSPAVATGQQQENENNTVDLCQAFAVVIRGWSQLGTLQGIEQAVDLACSSVSSNLMVRLMQHPDQVRLQEPIISVYHNLLRQSLSTIGAKQSSAKLLEHMEDVSQTFAGWEAIRLSDQQLQETLGSNVASSMGNGDRMAVLEHAETQLAFQQVLALVNQATQQDEEMVAQITAYLATLESVEHRYALWMAMAEYHVRIGNVVGANAYLARFPSPQELAGCGGERATELLGKAMVYWIQKSSQNGDTNDAASIHRAQELLQLLEQVTAVMNKSNTETKSVDSRLYVALANSWLRLGEPQKAISVALRPVVPSPEPFFAALKGLEQLDDQPLPELVSTKVLEWSRQLVEQMEPGQIGEMGNVLIPNLARSGRLDEAVELLNLMLRHGCSVLASAQASLLTSLSGEEHLAVLEQLSQSTTSGPLDSQSGLVILESLQPHLHQDHHKTVEFILSTLAENGESSELYRAVVDKVLQLGDPEWALWVLERAEQKAKDSSSTLPLSCYRDVIVALLRPEVQFGEDAQRLFRRLREEPPFGETPNSDFCEQYLANIYGNLEWVIQESLVVLEWLADMYQKTGDEVFKPKMTSYASLLSLLFKVEQESKVVRAAHIAGQVVDQMVEFDVHEGDIRPFHVAFQVAMRVPTKERFHHVHSIYRKMVGANVEVDAKTFHKLVWASMAAPDSESEGKQLQFLTDQFAQARQNGIITDESYSVMFRAIDRLAQARTREPLIQRLFLMCCIDGLLSSTLRDQAKELLSLGSWSSVYTSQLDENKMEPVEWSRSLNTNESGGDVLNNDHAV